LPPTVRLIAEISARHSRDSGRSTPQRHPIGIRLTVVHGATLRLLGSTLLCVLLLAGCAGGELTAHPNDARPAAIKSAASTTSLTAELPRRQTVARCTWHHLAMNYYGGGAGMGNDFGLIRLRDTATAPCRLTGRIGLVGLNATGALDTMTLIYHVANVLTLTPRTARIEVGHEVRAGTTLATIQIEAEYRDQPHGSPTGLCTKCVIPTRWRVTLATGPATVANADSNDPYTAFRRLLTCAGELNAPTPITSL
jgi:hypothetical protein